MAQITGSQTYAGYKIATTWGTAVAMGSGNKLIAEITPNEGVQEIVARSIGSGNQMAPAAIRGNIIPSVGLAMDLRYSDCCGNIIAQMMGTDTVSAEITAGQSDYGHAVTFNSTLNAKYGTVAWEDSSGTTYELPTTACRSFTVATGQLPGTVNLTADLVGNTVSLSSSTNTNAVLQGATLRNEKLVVASNEDSFYIRAQGVAGTDPMSGSYLVPITSFSTTFNRPQEIRPELRGTAGNAAPVSTGLFDVGFTVALSSMADHTWYTAWSNETIYNAVFDVQGTQIGSGSNYTFRIYYPAVQLVQAPQRPVTSEGSLPTTLTFRAIHNGIKHSSFADYYPSLYIINNSSASLLA